jgi:hypothetical protein
MTDSLSKELTIPAAELPIVAGAPGGWGIQLDYLLRDGATVGRIEKITLAENGDAIVRYQEAP